ncbi:uncharacterized protein LOC107981572 isoform X1 [Nasonia vitripennis]|uniref:SWIM-type domain-containing protein n=1 Tax=Nasonia vitripennis TaxID=7425 RepID=A0A7M7T986_NASVI|nr:uncharacterized protein LOC107981572 isoform X1 [Nasonia vitripennis]
MVDGMLQRDNLEAVQKTRGFISDKDLTERSVIREVFDWARLFICQFHTLRIFDREICPTKMKITKEEKENAFRCLDSMVKSSCQMDYDNAHSKFISTAPKVIKDYFIKNWQDITDEWVKFKIFNLNLKNLTNNRIESLNGKLKYEIGLFNSLTEFIKKIFKWTNYRLKCNRLKDIQDVLRINPNDVVITDFEKAKVLYKECLTHYAYKVVLEQFEYFEFMTLLNFDAVSQTCTAICRKEEIYITPYTCTCFEMTSMGLPCRHILAIRLPLKMSLFCKDICLERWLKSSENKRLSKSFESSPNLNSSLVQSSRPNISLVQSSRPNTVKPSVKAIEKKSSSSSRNRIENANEKDTTETVIKKVNTPSRLTIGEKRRRLKVIMDELMEVITEQSDRMYHLSSATMKNLLEHYKNNKDVSIVTTDKSSIDCIQSDYNLEESLKELSIERSNLTLANIKMPTPNKRIGKVREVRSCTVETKKK